LIPQIDSIRAVLAAAVEGPKVITIQHRVRSGETLSGISVQYGVSVAAIKQQNKLTSNMLRVGQRLTIEKQTDGKGGAQFAQSPPQKAPVQRVDNSSAVPASTARNTAYYTVKPGDSLWSISQGLPGVTVADLQKANNLNKNSKIKPGQKLKIQTG
jgi:membrane-bound lytic murein transglycosylase D